MIRSLGYNPVLCPLLLLHVDGGPNHRLTYISVQVSLVALFRSLNLDYLLATRTAPYHSYTNPVERCMSILNLGMQSLGLTRTKMNDDIEQALSSANSMSAICAAPNQLPALRGHRQQSLQPCIAMLNGVFSRLHLKGEPVTTHPAAADDEIDELWREMQKVDQELLVMDTTQKDSKDRAALKQYLCPEAVLLLHTPALLFRDQEMW